MVSQSPRDGVHGRAGQLVTERDSTRRELREKQRDRQALALGEYLQRAALTDEMGAAIEPIVMGLYGEVGSLMAVSKKRWREKTDESRHRDFMLEELGDVLWYFAALCRRLEQPISETVDVVTLASTTATYREKYEHYLIRLGEAAAALLRPAGEPEQRNRELRAFAQAYSAVVRTGDIGWQAILASNWQKVSGRFVRQEWASLPTFDASFPDDERLPEYFEIEIVQRVEGKAHLRWNGVFIGDPLTDNIGGADGYRFHDVFHLSNAAVLHWSPVVRKLIQHKRKSDPQFDEEQDSGRAIVVEEGVTAWLFGRAKEMSLFSERERLPFGILKTIQEFVRGYEVEACPLSLWEKAILDGYSVFRQVLRNGGGIVVGDRKERSIVYRPRKEAR